MRAQTIFEPCPAGIPDIDRLETVHRATPISGYRGLRWGHDIYRLSSGHIGFGLLALNLNFNTLLIHRNVRREGGSIFGFTESEIRSRARISSYTERKRENDYYEKECQPKAI
ncbi:hypothetical protein, partial [Nitrolancea hollandica]|uniref:hypothetical protein n=1 Tax=Nitrolancea hollandica TaxID=1206749 RepID=UPI001EE63B05